MAIDRPQIFSQDSILYLVARTEGYTRLKDLSFKLRRESVEQFTTVVSQAWPQTAELNEGQLLKLKADLETSVRVSDFYFEELTELNTARRGEQGFYRVGILLSCETAKVEGIFSRFEVGLRYQGVLDGGASDPHRNLHWGAFVPLKGHSLY